MVGAAAVSAARDAVLARVRAAARGASPPAGPERAYRRAGSLDREARVELACERIGDYRAEVRRVDADGLPAALAEVFDARAAKRIGIPPELPAEWLPEGLEPVVDGGLTPAELDALDGVLTGCTLAIAETGTLILSGGPAEGRRALTLVPDLHVCVVEESQIVELVPEATETLRALAVERRPLTFVSGPSATSDIELSRVEGVHGPRNLVVLVVSRERT
jgi:L-lactate dehydrogenase complex protein LldG